jgi:peroxiredoxin
VNRCSRRRPARPWRLRLSIVFVALCSALMLTVGLTGCGAGKGGGGKTPSSGKGAATDFTLESLEGKTVRLSDYLGKKVILIDFWSTTCKPCIAEMPELVKLWEKYKKDDFIMLAIAGDGPDTIAKVRSIVSDKKMTFPVLLDEETEVLDIYNPKGEMPHTVVIDRKGRIVLERTSFQAGDEASMKSLEKAITDALAAN